MTLLINLRNSAKNGLNGLKQIAVLTRAKIHKVLISMGLEEPEVESLLASYEWYKVHAVKHLVFVKSMYSLTIGDIGDIKHEIRQLSKTLCLTKTGETCSKTTCFTPDPNIKLSDWVKSMLSTITNIIQSAEDISLIPAISLQDKIKIVTDTKPRFSVNTIT